MCSSRFFGGKGAPRRLCRNNRQPGNVTNHARPWLQLATSAAHVHKALQLTTLIAALLLLVLLAVGRIGQWPKRETPPRQGEALDPVAYEHEQYVHSQEALSHRVREPLGAAGEEMSLYRVASR